MQDSLKNKFIRFLTGLIIAIILVGGVLAIKPSFIRGQNLKRQNEELTRLIAEKQREIDRLVENQRRFQTDPDFIEAIARQNGRVFPGELVFMFESD